MYPYYRSERWYPANATKNQTIEQWSNQPPDQPVQRRYQNIQPLLHFEPLRRDQGSTLSHAQELKTLEEFKLAIMRGMGVPSHIISMNWTHHATPSESKVWIPGMYDDPIKPLENKRIMTSQENKTQPNIQLEYGKRYVTREGKVTRALTKHPTNSHYVFWDEFLRTSYLGNGREYATTLSSNDLVKEYIEPEPEKVEDDPSKPSLILEEGKYYLNRDGEVIGPLKPDEDDRYNWADLKGETYIKNGCYYSDCVESRYDLISEYVGSRDKKIDMIVETEMQINDDGSLVKAKTDIVASGVAQVPYYSIEQIGSIFKEGEPKYGRDNWLKGVNDKTYQEQRAEHALRHLMLWMQGDRSENHLAKVGWFAVTQMELERRENLPNVSNNP